jgi:LysM repeat protein
MDTRKTGVAKASATKPATTAANRGALADARKPIRYKVRPGESLQDISQRFGVTVAMLRRWNNLGTNQAIQAGREISVYRDEPRLARAG